MNRLPDKIIVYSTHGCGYSDQLIAELKKEGKEFEEINLSLHPDRWEEVTRWTAGQKISPVMFEVTTGYNGMGCVY